MRARMVTAAGTAPTGNGGQLSLVLTDGRHWHRQQHWAACRHLQWQATGNDRQPSRWVLAQRRSSLPVQTTAEQLPNKSDTRLAKCFLAVWTSPQKYVAVARVLKECLVSHVFYIMPQSQRAGNNRPLRTALRPVLSGRPARRSEPSPRGTPADRRRGGARPAVAARTTSDPPERRHLAPPMPGGQGSR